MINMGGEVKMIKIHDSLLKFKVQQDRLNV